MINNYFLSLRYFPQGYWPSYFPSTFGRRGKAPQVQWPNWKEDAELKLSAILAKQLQQTLSENKELLQIASRSADQNRRQEEEIKQKLQVFDNLLGMLGAVRKIEPTIVPEEPSKPPMDPAKKAILMQRLDMARQAKEDKKQRREEFANQRLKNLAKGRRKQARIRSKNRL